jgi:YD repeat-containing protein
VGEIITEANNHADTFPSTLQESYSYDLAGNLQSKTDRKSQTIQYVYDALYWLSSKTYPDTTASAGSKRGSRHMCPGKLT